MARPIEHGMSYSRTYKSWGSMKARCDNPNASNYARYGGRGITYCPQWESFDVFLRDMGMRPTGTSLDREDNSGNYTKENCRWATASQQQANKDKFNQPVGRTYGGEFCHDCGAVFTKLSPRAKRCGPCRDYSRRYHAAK